MPSVREALEAAQAKVEGSKAPEPKGAPAPEVVPARPEARDSIPRGSVRADQGVTGKEIGRPEAKEPAPKPEPKVEVKTDAKAPERGPDGKFVSKKFPSSWKQDLSPVWEKPGGHSPDEWAAIQAEVHRRETEAAKNAQTLAEKLKGLETEWNPYSQVIGPYKDMFARRGIQPPQVIGQLLALAQQAENDFPGFIREQARLRGFDLAQLAAAETGQSQVDPAISALQRELASLKAQQAAQQQQTVQSAQSEVANQIQAFASATNSDGSPKHPHFERVKRVMGALMSADPALDLPGAYDRAVSADPELRAEVIAAQIAAQEAKRQEEARRAADAAKSATGNNSGTPVVLPKGSNVRSHLLKAWEQHMGGQRVQ